MRDPERIPIMLKQIKSMWEKYPDMRLGQLILNSIPPSSKIDLYYLEDDALSKCLEILDEKIMGVYKPQQSKTGN